MSPPSLLGVGKSRFLPGAGMDSLFYGCIEQGLCQKKETKDSRQVVLENRSWNQLVINAEKKKIDGEIGGKIDISSLKGGEISSVGEFSPLFCGNERLMPYLIFSTCFLRRLLSAP